jgi:hypothetical protein
LNEPTIELRRNPRIRGSDIGIGADEAAGGGLQAAGSPQQGLAAERQRADRQKPGSHQMALLPVCQGQLQSRAFEAVSRVGREKRLRQILDHPAAQPVLLVAPDIGGPVERLKGADDAGGDDIATAAPDPLSTV